MTTCVSWLELELYQLGERPEVATHVDRCPACRARLDSIVRDTRPRPPLPTVARRSWWRGLSLPVLLAPPLAATAIAAMLLVTVPPPARTTWKGGELSLSVVREDGSAATSFDDGERFKVLLTVVPGEHPWRLRVYQGAEHFDPLGHGVTHGGNGRPLPGAFRLTGPSDALVCVLVDAQTMPEHPEDLDAGAVCARLSGRPG